MSILQVATVLIYVTSVLTSPVNGSSESDQIPPSALTNLLGSFEVNDSLANKITLKQNNESTTVEDAKFEKSIPTEGGLVRHPMEKGKKSSIKDAKEEISSHEGSKQTSNTNVLEPDKRQKLSPIVPRKGAEYPEKDLSVTERSSTVMPAAEPQPFASTTEKAHRENNNLNNTKLGGSKNSNVSVIIVPSHPNDSVSHKRKPTLITGEGDDDGEGMPSSPTQPEIGMPRKVDYMIPIVITIMATPVLGIAAFVLYTRGRDCWDKRHYKRMDFLIDGMYND